MTTDIDKDIQSAIVTLWTATPGLGKPDSKGNNIGCHDRVETAYQIDGETEITREKLLALMERLYGKD